MKKHLLLRIGRFLRPYLLTLFLITVLMVGANLLAVRLGSGRRGHGAGRCEFSRGAA